MKGCSPSFDETPLHKNALFQVLVGFVRAYQFLEKRTKLKALTKIRKVIQQMSYNIAIYYYWCTTKNTYE